MHVLFDDNGCFLKNNFLRLKIPHSSAYTIVEKAIRFWHPDYNPNRAQKLISLSMSQHLSTRNMSLSMKFKQLLAD